jgi:hypothetical protein
MGGGLTGVQGSAGSGVDLLPSVSSGPPRGSRVAEGDREAAAPLTPSAGPEQERLQEVDGVVRRPPGGGLAAPRLVILESPFAPASCPQGGCGGPCAPRFPGGCRLLLSYGRAAVADSLRRGEAPMASHLLYTQALDDTRPAERRLGILAGLAWGRAAEATVVYADWGVSEGMAEGVARARAEGRPVEERRLGAPWGPR